MVFNAQILLVEVPCAGVRVPAPSHLLEHGYVRMAVDDQ